MSPQTQQKITQANLSPGIHIWQQTTALDDRTRTWASLNSCLPIPTRSGCWSRAVVPGAGPSWAGSWGWTSRKGAGTSPGRRACGWTTCSGTSWPAAGKGVPASLTGVQEICKGVAKTFLEGIPWICPHKKVRCTEIVLSWYEVLLFLLRGREFVVNATTRNRLTYLVRLHTRR